MTTYLLPKQFNASYNDDKYAEKRPRYFSRNLLAARLDPQAYEKNPGSLLLARSGALQFSAHDEFKSADIVERGNPDREIAKLISIFVLVSIPAAPSAAQSTSPSNPE